MTTQIPKYLFDRRDYKLLAIVNEVTNSRQTSAHTRGELYAQFHPEGIKELAETRGLRIAYATILMLQSLATGRVEDRLGALRALRDEVIDTAIGPMPRNTARVLLQIMKELVRAYGDQRAQLELAHDFRAATSGKPRIVRAQLRKYHLLEMPESWDQIAFDDHVHDANTKGRKTPTHLIMDAWIKGIRRLRVIYYNHISSKSAMELMQAARIMGITLRIGIEFATRFRGKYAQLIWVPRGFHDEQALLCFLAEHAVASFLEEGRKVSAYQEKHVLSMLRAFNEHHRAALAEEYGVDLPELTEADFTAYVAPGQASLLHLAKYIHAVVMAHLPPLMDDLRQAYFAAVGREEEHRRIADRVDRLNRLNAETILAKYLHPSRNPSVPDPGVPQDDPDLPALLRLSPHEMVNRLESLHAGYRITLNLSNLQAEDVLEILYDCEGKITRLEIFNLKDFDAGITAHVPPIIELQHAINQGNVIALKRIIRRSLAQLSSGPSPDRLRIARLKAILHDIISMKAFYAGTPLKARIGSDSTGGSPRTHGMGLVVDDTLPKRAKREIRRFPADRLRLPIRVSVAPQVTYRQPLISDNLTRTAAFLRCFPGCGKIGLRREDQWEFLEYDPRVVPQGNIITLGGLQEPMDNGLSLDPDQEQEACKPRNRPYWNSLLKNGLKIMIGFIPAFATFALTKEWWVLAYGGALIWFGITGLRNILQSVLGGGGLRHSPLLRWNDLISWERISDSLLFTGFSVPLLDYITKTLILDRGLGITTTTHPIALYTLMALANGIYLSSHNIFRGFPRGVVAGNFFRSVLSIPLAVLLNSLIGLVLSAAGVESIALVLQNWAAIISKTASDTVAGIIEGLADRLQNIERRRKALRNKFHQILDTYAELEMSLPEAQTLEFLQSPDKYEQHVPADTRDLVKNMYVHALDLLYFWMYQPRTRNAMQAMLNELSPDESRVILESQSVLAQQRAISMLFIEGVLGQGFSRPLAFYLSQSPEYLAAVQRMIAENNIALSAAGHQPGRQAD